MGSSFKAIMMLDSVWSIVDELSQECELSIENAKSDTTKTVLELGYQACLKDFMKKLPSICEGCSFVNKDDIHWSENGHIPYEDDTITPILVHKEGSLWDPIMYSEANNLPDVITVHETKYKKIKE